MRFKNLFLCLLSCIGVAVAHAQQSTIVSGSVVNEDGAPLQGATVTQTGTANTAVTNQQGQFKLTVTSPTASLNVSYIGYITAVISLNNQSGVSIVLQKSEVKMDEVVVVGYGTQLKKDVTGSVTTVSSAKLLDKPAVNIGQALQGKVAGVKVIEVSGAPGSAALIRIRGTNSINSSNDPLFVVDGIVGFKNALTTLNPNIIQSLEVLKDASATAIYGARGANGVVIITTKRGLSGKPTIEYNAYVSSGYSPRKWDVLTADQEMYIYEQGWANQLKYTNSPNRSKDFRGPKASGLSYSELGHLFEEVGKGGYFLDLVGKDGKFYKPRFQTMWEDEAYQKPISSNHQLNIRGGSENAKFGLFLGVTDEQGVMKKTGFNRYSARVTADVKATDWLDVSTSLTYNNSVQRLSDQGSISRVAVESFTILPIKYPDDPAIYGKYAGQYSKNSDFPLADEWSNAVNLLNSSVDNNYRNQVTGDLGLNFKITKDLSLKSTLAVEYFSQKQNQYFGRDIRSSSFLGRAYIGTSTSMYWQNENYLNYVKEIGDHNFTGLLGVSWSEISTENFNGTNSYFFDDFYQWHNIAAGTAPRPSINSNDSKSQLNSYFARANYRYKQKFLLTLTGRVDGSSKFGVNSKYGFFPSGAFAWIASKEEFIKNIPVISNLKLRLGAGETGNQEIGSYLSQTYIGSGNVVIGGAAQPGLFPNSVGNPDLKWEKTLQYNAGLDIGLWGDRVSLVLDVYHKLTSDMLLTVPLPQSTTTGSVKKNYGSIQNRGIEIALNTHNIKTKDFNWYTDITFSANQNKIVTLGPTGADIFGNYFESVPHTILRVGEPVGTFWGLTRLGVYGTEEASLAARYNLLPGDIKYEDKNKDGKISYNLSDAGIRGNAFPRWEADFNNSFTYKNFDFNIEFRVSIGATQEDWTMLFEDVHNYGGAKNTVLNSWTPYHQNTNQPEARVLSGGAYMQDYADTRWSKDASFLRGEGATLGYSHRPKSGKGIQSLRVYLNAKNFSLYAPNFTSLDPEGGNVGDAITPGLGFYTYPRPSSFTLGVNLVF
jgi:TonB-linked SusC/RagA family outer membrane protein